MATPTVLKIQCEECGLLQDIPRPPTHLRLVEGPDGIQRPVAPCGHTNYRYTI